MDARDGAGPSRCVRTHEPSEAGEPARPRPADAPDDESREQGDAETYAVLGED
ncbi:hypothetical protein RMN57_02030 [Kitasatospora sp. CM 4170]|uniref:Uncharacterized protein n=1 Tax=Kitasatospora aburaviensis TaxID=67265 RepID=A0ABW1EZZ1_9ACTN|nr:hypothetical protein [Kitasatospora sp. CM 4170]WNM43561.1 hypothetical protein RMN57_02030 [Kitasatospora sp. CM 4170]